MDKSCFKCLQSKPLVEFYKHSAMSDGHLGKCKECTKRDARRNRESNIDEHRKYDRERHVGDRRLKSLASASRWRSEHAYERAAQNAVAIAVRDGRLKKPDCCSRCCSTMPKRLIHGHHEDYGRPLEVIWLCVSCHRKHHAKLEQKVG